MHIWEISLFSHTNIVKVLLFIGTNLRGLYRMHLIHGFLNSWFQTLQTTMNGKIVFRWI
jgi:hypothetical protein